MKDRVILAITCVKDRRPLIDNPGSFRSISQAGKIALHGAEGFAFLEFEGYLRDVSHSASGVL